MEARRTRPLSIISAVLFLVYGICFLRNIITDISNAIEFSKVNDASAFNMSVVINIVTGLIVLAAIVWTIILLLKNDNKKSLGFYPVSKIIAGMLTSNLLLFIKNLDMFVHLSFGIQLTFYISIIRWIGYLILLFYIILNCVSSKKRENKRWYIPCIIITACYIVNTIISLTNTSLNSLVVSVTALGIAEAIIEGAAILMLCLWLKYKNDEGKLPKKTETAEKKPAGEVITKSADDPWKDFYWKKPM